MTYITDSSLDAICNALEDIAFQLTDLNDTLKDIHKDIDAFNSKLTFPNPTLTDSTPNTHNTLIAPPSLTPSPTRGANPHSEAVACSNIQELLLNSLTPTIEHYNKPLL